MKRIICTRGEERATSTVNGMKVYGRIPDSNIRDHIEVISSLRNELAKRYQEITGINCNSENISCRIISYNTDSVHAIFIYFGVYTADILAAMDVSDPEALEYVIRYCSDYQEFGGNFSINPNFVECDSIREELIKNDWLIDNDTDTGEIERALRDYYATTNGDYTSDPVSFDWTFRSLFGRSFNVNQSGDFIQDLDDCYQLLNDVVSDKVPGFQLDVEREYDQDTDEYFEDVVKLRFANTVGEIRVSSSNLEDVYNSKGSRGLIIEMLKWFRGSKGIKYGE